MTVQLFLFEKLIEVLPKIKMVTFNCFGPSPKLSNITNKTVNELLKLPHFSKIEKFVLLSIPEQFDIKTFFNFLKKNKIPKSELFFHPSISEAHNILLETIVDEIIENENHDYQVPFIHFYGSILEKRGKLYTLCF
uniref:Uncharacterized protein n=1 Tax=Panagrolaimus davidi TaxID=227884 RepID=A0A914PPH0_9BILA